LNVLESAISLRPATLEDREMIFRWRNDPFIVAHGSWHRAVEWEEHEKWFEETVRGKNRQMFIILHQDKPIGQIRFDRENQSDSVVSVYLMQPFTGRGWGSQAIRMGCEAIFQVWDVDRVLACVRLDNTIGRAAFLKAAFRETSAALCPAEHYSLVLSRVSKGRGTDS
jgi:UDP-2,4-diacetamido-2,4,6-trideoxy-beta-L-altropyranose hydrolase